MPNFELLLGRCCKLKTFYVMLLLVVCNIQKIAKFWKTWLLLYAHYLTMLPSMMHVSSWPGCDQALACLVAGTWARSPYKVIIIIMIMIIYLTWPGSILSRQVNVIKLKSTSFKSPVTAVYSALVYFTPVEVMRCQSKFQLKSFQTDKQHVCEKQS